MKTQLLSYFILLLFFLPSGCSSQTAKSKLTEEEFKKFDANESGWLSGNELKACNCKNFDADGDNEITKEEFFAGKGSKITANTKTNTDATANQTKVKTQAKTVKEPDIGNAGTNISGAWWHATMLYADGTVYELRNRQSSLEIKEDGKYTLNTWFGGANNMRTVGNYTQSSNRLTLTPSGGGDKQVYKLSVSADGKLMTIISGDGSGYKLERGK